MSTRLLRLHEVADRLGLSLHTIRRWASERRLPVVKLGRAVLVDERDLAKLIEARRVQTHRDLAI